MANDKSEKKVKKEKKRFLKDFKAELKKVTWPTGKQLVNNTVAVITIVIITALIVFVLDLCFEKLNTYGINKIKAATRNNETTTVVDDNSQSEDENSESEAESSENEAVNEAANEAEEQQETTPEDAE